MILHKLYEFSHTIENLNPPGFVRRLITKKIYIDSATLTADAISPTKEKQGKLTGEYTNEPQESPRRTSGISPRLFSDNATYAFGMTDEGSSQKQIAKAEQAHQAWSDQIKRCAVETQDPNHLIFLKWLHSPDFDRIKAEISANDDVAFLIDDQPLSQLPSSVEWWSKQGGKTKPGICMITGQKSEVTESMPIMISGVPGGQTSGTALFSINFDAAESHGLKGALNSPISLAAADRICKALNHLIRYRIGAKSRPLHATRVGETLFIGWLQDHPLYANPISLLMEPAQPSSESKEQPSLPQDSESLSDPDEILDLIRALGLPRYIRDERFEHILDPEQRLTTKEVAKPETPFYVLVLSANAARIVVRNFINLTADDLVENEKLWFQRLTIGSKENRPSIYGLAKSLYREAKDIPNHVAEKLGLAALRGKAPDPAFLTLALQRNRAMNGPFTTSKSGQRIIDSSRLALIKSVLVPDPHDQSLNMLNTEHENPAYHCGRLLATLEWVQESAISGLNASLVERNFASACASPGHVLPRLVKNAVVAHLPKIRKEKGGLHHTFQKELAAVQSKIGDQWPTGLSQRDQGLFVLGYYHQRENRFTSKENKEVTA